MGGTVTRGYYPQNADELVPKGITMLDWLLPLEPEGDMQVVRGLLGRMLFAGDEALKSTEKLSGGRRHGLLWRV